MKLLPNHMMVWEKIYYKLISDIIINDYTSQLENFKIIYFIFNWFVYPLISCTKSRSLIELRIDFEGAQAVCGCRPEYAVLCMADNSWGNDGNMLSILWKHQVQKRSPWHAACSCLGDVSGMLTSVACCFHGIAWHAAKRPRQPHLVHRLLGQNPMNMGILAGTGKEKQNLRSFSL